LPPSGNSHHQSPPPRNPFLPYLTRQQQTSFYLSFFLSFSSDRLSRLFRITIAQHQSAAEKAIKALLWPVDAVKQYGPCRVDAQLSSRPIGMYKEKS
jgi:hypothetical protein